jgi:hypothetical protein
VRRLIFLTNHAFWIWALSAVLLASIIFAWELDVFASLLPSPPRPPVTRGEFAFVALLVILLGLNAGLFGWRRALGTCPLGVRRATGVGAALGAATLLCPVCLLVPVTLLGASVSLSVLAPFVPLLRTITLLVLLATTSVLWPRSPIS